MSGKSSQKTFHKEEQSRPSSPLSSCQFLFPLALFAKMAAVTVVTNSNMHNLTTLIKRYTPKLQLLMTLVRCLDMDQPVQRSMCSTNRSGRLLTAFRRLEAATSRLEDMATSIDSSHPETVATISNAQLHATNAAAAATAAPLAPPAAAEPLPASIEDFDKLIDDNVRAFVTSSEKIGGLVGQQVWRREISTVEQADHGL